LIATFQVTRRVEVPATVEVEDRGRDGSASAETLKDTNWSMAGRARLPKNLMPRWMITGGVPGMHQERMVVVTMGLPRRRCSMREATTLI